MSALAPPASAWPARYLGEERAELVALASLPAMTSATLRRLLAEATPRQCWTALCRGCLPALANAGFTAERRRRVEALAPRWGERAREIDPAARLASWRARGLEVLLAGDTPFPLSPAANPASPWVLFCRGSAPVPGPRVAVVGTRSSTSYGESIAAELAEGLVASGLSVTTSLEAGIGAAARSGALRGRARGGGGGLLAYAVGGADLAPPGPEGGLDPTGCVASEAPFGARPERWRFARRNRLIAASSDVVVVVEAHRAGGALHAAEAALGAGIPVCAVPGSVRSPSSKGTNSLLADGAHVVRELDDLLAVVGLCCPAPVRAGGRVSSGPRADEVAAPLPSGPDAEVLACVEETTTPLEAILQRSRQSLGAGSLALERLAAAGLVRRVAGGYERLGGRHGRSPSAHRLQV